MSGTDTMEPALKDKNRTTGNIGSPLAAGGSGKPGAEPPGGPSESAVCAGAELLAEALQRNARGLWRFLSVRVGGDENLAEELMQELCLQAVRTRTAAGRTAEHVDAWLFGVARNVLRRHWRTLTRRRRNLPEVRVDIGRELADRMDQAPLPGEYLQRREVQEQLLLALTALPTEDQNLILEHYFDGRSQVEIAAKSGLTPRAVEGRLYRARQALRERLRHLEEEILQ